MKCPLLKNMRPIAAGWEEAFFGDCLKEECGFWSSFSNACPFSIIPEELHWIADRLQAVASNMPKDLAPRG